MSDDLVSRLRSRYVEQTTSLGDFGTHTIGAPDELCQEAATALTEARAEIERLRDTNDRVARVDNSLAKQLRASIENNAALVNELSTLRAHVREVVGPFVSHYEPWMDKHDPETQSSTFPRHTFAQLNAARQLMEKVK